MLKETETEETIVFFVTFLLLVAFQLGGEWAPLATPMADVMLLYICFDFFCCFFYDSIKL